MVGRTIGSTSGGRTGGRRTGESGASATRPAGPALARRLLMAWPWGRCDSRVRPSAPRRCWRARTASSRRSRAPGPSCRPPAGGHRLAIGERGEHGDLGRTRAPSGVGSEAPAGWFARAGALVRRRYGGLGRGPLGRACAAEACGLAPWKSGGRARQAPCASGRLRRRAGQGAPESVHADGRLRWLHVAAVPERARSYTSQHGAPWFRRRFEASA